MTDSSAAFATASSNALNVLAASPAIIVFGVPLGITLDVLVWGIVGSAFSLLLNESKPLPPNATKFTVIKANARRVCLAILSALIGGGSAPALHDLTERLMPSLQHTVTYLIAIVVGYGAQTLLPKAVEGIPALFTKVVEHLIARIAPSTKVPKPEPEQAVAAETKSSATKDPQ